MITIRDGFLNIFDTGNGCICGRCGRPIHTEMLIDATSSSSKKSKHHIDCYWRQLIEDCVVR